MAEVPAVRLRRDDEVDFLARNARSAHVCHVRRHPSSPSRCGSDVSHSALNRDRPGLPGSYPRKCH
jgi:hypothetical protein